MPKNCKCGEPGIVTLQAEWHRYGAAMVLKEPDNKYPCWQCFDEIERERKGGKK